MDLFAFFFPNKLVLLRSHFSSLFKFTLKLIPLIAKNVSLSLSIIKSFVTSQKHSSKKIHFKSYIRKLNYPNASMVWK